MRASGLILLCLLVASGQGALQFKSGVHSDLCTWGSQYWCSSIKTAERCGKTEFCTTKVWPLKIIQDIQCQVTQQVVKSSRQLLDSRMYKMSSFHDMAIVIAKACGHFEDDERRLQCKALVTDKDILPKLLKLIATRLPTESVALAVGGCQRQKPLAEKCQTCEEFTRSIQHYVSKTLSQDAYLHLFRPACDRVGQGAKTCMYAVSTRYHTFRQGLLKTKPNQVCAGKSLCLKKNVFSNAENLDTCSACKDVVQALRELDRNQEVQSVVQDLLKSACTYMGGFKELCDLVADEGLAYVFEIIASELEPTVICEKFELCSAQQNNLISVPTTAKKDEGSTKCIICQSIVTEIETFITSKGASAELDKVLKMFCAKQPSSLYEECSSFIDQFGPVIIQLIVSNVPPKNVCKFINVCKDKVEDKKTLQDTPTCALCEFMMTELDNLIGSNNTEQALEQALDNVCKKLPGTITTACEDLVNQYSPVIITLIVNKLDPKLVCTKVGLCKNSTVERKKTLQETPSCVLCEFVMTELDKLIGSNDTEQALQQALDNVCKKLPGTITTACEDLVNQYSPLIITLIVNKLDPKLVCTKLGLCKNSRVISTRPVGKQKTEICALCITLMQYAEKYLDRNSTEKEIIAVLDKVCNILPESDKPFCTYILPTVVNYVVQMIEQKVDPEDACKVIKLCAHDMVDSSKVHTKLSVDMTVKQEEQCILCKFIMGEIDNLLEENATKEDITAAIDKVCDILPDEIKAQCIPFVKLYAPYVVDLLVQHLVPSEICSRLGICNNKTAQNPLKKSSGSVEVRSGELCPICIYVFTALDNFLEENSTEKAVIAALDQVCNVLPDTIKDQCIPFVALYAPYVVDLIVEGLSPKQICGRLGICTNKGLLVKDPKSYGSIKDSQLCDFCEEVFTSLDGILKENSTQEQIETALERVCDIIPSTMKAECTQLIETFTPQIINMLLQRIQPKQMCMSLGLCTNIAGRARLLKMPKVASGEFCTVCELVLNYVDQLLKDNATQQELKQVLEEVCNVLPSTLSTQCTSLVDQYFVLIISVFEQLSPQEICTSLSLCQSKGKLRQLKMPKATSGELCTVCEFALNYVDQLLKDNATQQELKQVLEEVCNVLPSTLSTECTTLVDQYFTLIINVFEQLSPQQICTSLGLCQSKGKLRQLKMPKASGELCTVCEFAMNYVDQLLKDNATQQALKQALEEVCNVLPSTLSTECTALVDQYFVLIINVFEQLSPQQICTSLGLCQSKGKFRQLKMPKATSGELCTVCEFAMNYVDQLLKDNATQQEIKQVLEEVCNLLPSTLSTECTSLVDQYFVLIINIFEQLSPQEICTSLGLCQSRVKESTKVNGVECIMCEYVMSKLENMIISNRSVSKISKAIETVCGLMPVTIKKDCDDFIEKYSTLILELLMQEVRPRQVCMVLGLCSSESIYENERLVHAAPTKNSIKSDELCTICEAVMTELYNILTSPSSEAEVKEALEKVCTFLPQNIQEQCKNIVDVYAGYIINLIIQEVSPKMICGFLRLCESTVKQDHPVLVMEMSFPKAGPLCPLCEYIINTLDKTLEENSTEAQIEAALDKVCNFLPATIKDDCIKFVGLYTPQVIDLLVKNIDAEVVCTLLKLCSNTGLTQGHSILGKEIGLPKAAPLCPLCEYVINTLDQMLEENSTEAQIEATLDKVCNILPSTIKDDCIKFVGSYTPQVIDMLVKKIDAKVICTLLKLCNNTATFQDHSILRKEINLPKAAPYCPLCEYIINTLDQTLEQNSTEAQIEAALDKVCNLLPATIKDDCIKFVALYTPQVIDLLVKNIDAEVICTLLKLCNNTGMTQGHSILGKEMNFPKASPLCPLCEYVINTLDQMLEENSTEAQIEAALDKVCNILPSTIKDDCIKFVGSYTPQVIDMLVKKIDAQVICTLLKLCNNTAISQVNNVPVKPKADLSAPTCLLCELVIGKIESIVKSKSSEADIEAALEKVCGYLPSEFKEECDDFVKKYTSQIIQLILADYTAEEICTKLGFCSSSKEYKISLKSVEGCSLCKFVLEELQGVLWSPIKEEEATDALKQICNELPSSLQTACRDLVIMLTPNLMDFIGHRIYPKGICEFLELCVKSVPSNSLRIVSKQESVITPDPHFGKNCTACKFAFYGIQGALSTPYWQAETKAGLLLFCQKVKTWPDICQYIVNQNLPGLISQIGSYNFPLKFCQELNICDHEMEEKQSNSLTFVSEQQQMMMTPPSPQYLKTCTACKFAWYASQTILKSPFWQAETKTVLLHLCKKVQTWPEVCQYIVTQNLPTLIDEIQGFNFPVDFCQELNVCEAPSKGSNRLAANDVECEICKTLAEIADAFLQKNSTVEEAKTLFNKVCNTVVPEAERSQCMSLVQEYTPFLLQLVAEVMDPQKVCETIKLCPKVSGYDVYKILQHGGH